MYFYCPEMAIAVMGTSDVFITAMQFFQIFRFASHFSHYHYGILFQKTYSSRIGDKWMGERSNAQYPTRSPSIQSAISNISQTKVRLSFHKIAFLLQPSPPKFFRFDSRSNISFFDIGQDKVQVKKFETLTFDENVFEVTWKILFDVSNSPIVSAKITFSAQNLTEGSESSVSISDDEEDDNATSGPGSESTSCLVVSKCEFRGHLFKGMAREPPQAPPIAQISF
jgi:hypothetical protein